MVADFKASGVAKHRGSKGTVREAQLLSNYLRKYLPRTVRAEHGGEVVAVNGAVSRQCDILIVDPSTPPFWDEENYRIVPAECVYGVIEVKSFLDSAELRKAAQLIADAKALPKTAYFPSPPNEPQRTRAVYGRDDWPYVPTVGMVFAYDGADADTLCKTFGELANQYPSELCLDSVWVLDKGFINWWDSAAGMIEPTREPGCTYRAFAADPQQMLMPFTAHLHRHFVSAWMPTFRITDYIAHVSWGNAVCEGVLIPKESAKA
jgi:hypothetical protein